MAKAGRSKQSGKGTNLFCRKEVGIASGDILDSSSVAVNNRRIHLVIPTSWQLVSTSNYVDEWLIELIRDPKSKKTDAHMYPYAGMIDDEGMQALAAYLASLTGDTPKEATGEAATSVRVTGLEHGR